MREVPWLSLPSELHFETPPALLHLVQEEFLAPIDLHLVGFLMRSGVTEESVLWGAAFANHAVRQGHLCLDLNEVAGTPVQREEELVLWEGRPLRHPELASWRSALYDTHVCGRPEDRCPLILDDSDRLYLFRYWQYETLLAERLLRFPGPLLETGFAKAALRERLDQLFPQGEESELNWQRVAAISALHHPLCVISGGPGTGKTTTVLSVLLLLQEQHERLSLDSRRLRVALAAPTGKAAARLNESIVAQKEKRAAQETDPGTLARIAAIPEEVRTLHRLLGTRPNSPYFRHNQEHPLPYDVVIVDEASMVDLPMMAKLLSALSPGTRLLLLGDKDQLASVEAGAVLGELCSAPSRAGYSARFAACVADLAPFGDKLTLLPEDQQKRTATPLQDHIVQLRKSHRFDSESGIGRLAALINRGEGAEALRLLQASPEGSDVTWKPLSPGAGLLSSLRELVLEGYAGYLAHLDDPGRAFAAFDSFRILCAHRGGDRGVRTLNRQVEQILREAGLLHETDQRWYAGRPVMIQRNDYGQKLFNGDVGLLLPDPSREGALSAFFPNAGKEPRAILPARLPAHETVFAMTVHKSQGSEFSRVLLLLPEAISPILTRELVYTGLTRARDRVDLWGHAAVFQQALKKRVVRSSGLRERLWAK